MYKTVHVPFLLLMLRILVSLLSFYLFISVLFALRVSLTIASRPLFIYTHLSVYCPPG